jgi:hypothetical protein
MDFADSPEHAAFRVEFRQWLLLSGGMDDANRRRHIFGNPRHNLDVLVRQ